MAEMLEMADSHSFTTEMRSLELDNFFVTFFVKYYFGKSLASEKFQMKYNYEERFS